jgi:hypothetical protein
MVSDRKNSQGCGVTTDYMEIPEIRISIILRIQFLKAI